MVSLGLEASKILNTSVGSPLMVCRLKCNIECEEEGGNTIDKVVDFDRICSLQYLRMTDTRCIYTGYCKQSHSLVFVVTQLSHI